MVIILLSYLRNSNKIFKIKPRWDTDYHINNFSMYCHHHQTEGEEWAPLGHQDKCRDVSVPFLPHSEWMYIQWIRAVGLRAAGCCDSCWGPVFSGNPCCSWWLHSPPGPSRHVYLNYSPPTVELPTGWCQLAPNPLPVIPCALLPGFPKSGDEAQLSGVCVSGVCGWGLDLWAPCPGSACSSLTMWWVGEWR